MPDIIHNTAAVELSYAKAINSALTRALRDMP